MEQHWPISFMSLLLRLSLINSNYPPTQMTRTTLALVVLGLLCSSTAAAAASAPPPFVGLNIGTSVTNLLSPSSLAAFLKSQSITHIRLYDPDPDLLHALANASVAVALGVPNNQLLALGSSPATATNWVSRYVLPFHPATLISLITVGDEVLTSFPSSSPVLLPAMEAIHSALLAAGLAGDIKVSTPFSAAVIIDPFPPSQAFFNQSLSNLYILPILHFLANTSSPIVLNLYPYYVFMRNRGVIPLDNALFKPLLPSKEMVDPNTLLHYTNVLDAMIDAAYFSMKNLNVTDVPVLVGETGWPSKGDPKAEPYATRDNADTYNSNLIKRILVDRVGTPLQPESTPSAYIYELFNEDFRPGPLSEANWGLFYGNGTPVYLLHVSGTGGFLANDTTNRTFCVAAEGVVDPKMLQAALDWACGPGRTDCSAIQPGENCYDPNNVRSHASYAFDSYYQKQRKAAGSCYFQGVAMVTTTDPRDVLISVGLQGHGRCIFPGSKQLDNTTRAGVNSAQTNDDTVSSGSAKGQGRLKWRGVDCGISSFISISCFPIVTIILNWRL